MTAINYSREYRSAGEGVLYGIPTQVGVFELPKDNAILASGGLPDIMFVNGEKIVIFSFGISGSVMKATIFLI